MGQQFSASSKVTRRKVLGGGASTMLLVSGGALVAGCTTAPDSGEDAGSDVIELTITAAGNINPGPTGAAAPLALQIFTLRSAGQFSSLDYFALRDQGASLLAADIVDRRSLSVLPGQTTTVTLRGVDATTLGVAAGYRDIDNANWRATASLGDDSEFIVRAGRASISVGRG